MSKDWNQDLQDLGIQQLRRLLAGAGAIEVAAEPVGMAAEHSPPAGDVVVEVAPELRVEGTDEAAQGAESVEKADRAEVGELRGWLRATDLPHTSLQLWPWLKIVDVARFAVTLQAELSSEEIGPRWPEAMKDLRRLARIYSGVEDGHPQESSQLGRAPPLTGTIARTGMNQPLAQRVHVGGAHVG